ncbi:MAG: hypothetical protein RLZZ546_2957 [Bacteroidota bacterium]|jgi:dihydroorotate dehydrogenase
MYKLIKPILFLFDAENVHHSVMRMLAFFYALPFGKKILKSLYDAPEDQKISILGLNFKNRIGLAAGFDKNGKYIDELACLGFGFIEVGTVTPKSQYGNPKPRLFRILKDKAIINRMGFNNDGVDSLIENLKHVKNKNIIIGGNIGKNKNTDNENAIHDYKHCFSKLYNYVHYFVINVSSPNTPGLRELQDKKPLTQIIEALTLLRQSQKVYKPILLKIAPDLSLDQLDDIVDICNDTLLDGLIVSNTTVDRSTLTEKKEVVEKIGNGGLSGKPLLSLSNKVLKYLSSKTSKTIIGVGGIQSQSDYFEKINNGASLVQVYTGFIYEGPSLVKILLNKK